MIFVDPDLWEGLQGDIEAELMRSHSYAYDCGQDKKLFPASEVPYVARRVVASIEQAFKEQAERDCDRRGVQAGS